VLAKRKEDMKMGKGKKNMKELVKESQALEKEFVQKEKEIINNIRKWSTKAGFTDSQIAELTLIEKVLRHKPYTSLDQYQAKGISTNFSFIGYCLGLALPKGLTYASAEKEFKKQGKTFYDQVKATQSRLNRLFLMIGVRQQSRNRKKRSNPYARVLSMIMGKSLTDQDRLALLLALQKWAKEKGQALPKAVNQ